MQNYKWLLICLTCLCALPGFTQINQTANDVVPPYYGEFGYGVNLDYYPNWEGTDTLLANIAAGNPASGVVGAGVKSLRVALPEWFMNYFGQQIRVADFQHYHKIGMRDHTVFIGNPEDAHKDTLMYCDSIHSQLFANMYEPIWDNGENGTPVNDDNHMAIYLWKTVNTYGPYVKYWEVMNEPDLSWTPNAWLPRGTAGSWWETDPDPCDTKMKAPVQHYVRMLRIAYEVIKYIDPDDYITTGGIGYPSFLHCILRNTDNPDGGKVSAEYPLKGGAYFDVLSYHSYPHVEGRYRIDWNPSKNDFDYLRNSDYAADGVTNKKVEFDDVFAEFGYDGSQFPKKRYIITETNIPRHKVLPGGDNYGNDEIQRNWTIKTFINVQKYDIDHVHFYRLGEDVDPESADHEFQLMGLYKNLNTSVPYTQEFTNQGIAFKTMSETLSSYKFDQAQTDLMALPNSVRGAAFKNNEDKFRYVIWAETTMDKSEVAYAEYTFPESFNLLTLHKTNWSHSIDGEIDNVSSETIILSGEPVFLVPDKFKTFIDLDGDGFTSDEDCDDNNPESNPGAVEIPNNDIDENCDGIVLIIDDDNDGYNSDEDCDDNNTASNPGATEIPNNDIDEDCDGIALIIDDDNDGFNSDEDCDDNNPEVNSGTVEIPNNDIDEDCDGIALIIDDDNDGFNSDEDCDDNNPDVNPNALEIPNNGIDENCDGTEMIIDNDGDGFNSDEDCDDNDPNINPSVTEIPNNETDENCDGISLIIDNDLDGFNSDEDCDDNNPDIYPGAIEIINNDLDENCDGLIEIIDNDGDGWNSDIDCNDFHPGVYPGAVEIPNNDLDENCDGTVWVIDEDGDGYHSDIDCDDNNPDISPGTPEIPNNDVDEDCDGEMLYVQLDNGGELDPNTESPDQNPDQVTSTEDDFFLQDVKIYPNPFRESLNIKADFDEEVEIILYNTLGVEVIRQVSRLSKDGFRIETSTMEAGIYFILLQTKSGNRLHKRSILKM